ncbi:MAG: recombination mediator RecR [Gammaproteobacteria bacterium]|nr:recombination mediator RecR [Gammaproteobacteria bacterium]
MSFSPLITQLIDALRCLPGVGPKSAQRMAMHLLEKERKNGAYLANTIHLALEKVGRCEKCRTLCESTLCRICSNTKRNQGLVCIVETPMDILAIEQSGGFSGIYFVLMGHLSPLDGIGPKELKLEQLDQYLAAGEINEVILAISPTVEGQATGHYIMEMVKAHGKSVSRISYGVPFGGELEYVDSNTLSHAINSRQLV